MPLEPSEGNGTPKATVVEPKADKMKLKDKVKLSAIVALFTVLLVLMGLNFRERTPVDLIVVRVEVWPAVTIMVSFLLGAGCTLLVILVRKARKR